MNTKDREAERAAIVAEGLTENERYWSRLFLGNSWTGRGEPSKEVQRLIDLGLVQTVSLGSRFKAFTTERGMLVRDHVRGEQ